MAVFRHENSYPNSPIKAVVAYIGDNCGNIGPHFMIQGKDGGLREMPRDQLEDFLNHTTGAVGDVRIISKELEAAVFADFSDVLEKSGRLYRYTGPINAGSYKINNSYTAYHAGEGLISAANSLGVQEKSGNFTASESQGVSQHEVALTSADSKKPVLGTLGAGPCFIVAAYNKKTQQALLAHVDMLTDLDSLRLHLNNLGGNAQDKIQIHLLGGNDGTRVQASEIISIINDRGDAEIVSARICSSLNRESGEQLAIDARTGEVFTNFTPEQLDLGADFDFRNLTTRRSAALNNRRPLTLVYDGTKPDQKQHAQEIVGHKNINNILSAMTR